MEMKTETKRASKRKIASKVRNVVSEDLSKFFPEVSRMGGVGSPGQRWTNFNFVKRRCELDHAAYEARCLSTLNPD